ncbi:solute carrier family 41 member 3 isoform X8 [Rhipicephalus microplus]|uniref:solute carrier family 41 member 3 isoform X8 n=1 Tax=Rhipicephalus microplus TaxID=6941 RepID=UPI003F6B3068
MIATMLPADIHGRTITLSWGRLSPVTLASCTAILPAVCQRFDWHSVPAELRAVTKTKKAASAQRALNGGHAGCQPRPPACQHYRCAAQELLGKARNHRGGRDHTDWPVYSAYRELFVLIPPLLGLNGNLEMTLVARMSTQCQSTVVALVACGLALAKGFARHGGTITPLYACMLCACGLTSANVASMVLGAFMTTVVLVARRCGLNPDNVAAPIAASLGDLTTLTLLSTVSSRLLVWKDSPLMTPGVVALSVLLLPMWFFLAFKHENTRSVLKVGWPPILAAVMVSSFGGYILDFSVIRFEGIALHLSAVNAVGGNLAAIYCCRLSTFLSRRVEMGVLPPEDATRCANPLVLFAGSSEVGRVARILLLVVIPGQLIFLTATDLLRYGSFNVTPLFGFLYVLVALVQVAILLLLSRSLVYWLWWWRVDPDNAAIPFITAAGDFTGTGLLTVAFFALEHVTMNENQNAAKRCTTKEESVATESNWSPRTTGHHPRNTIHRIRG